MALVPCKVGKYAVKKRLIALEAERSKGPTMQKTLGQDNSHATGPNVYPERLPLHPEQFLYPDHNSVVLCDDNALGRLVVRVPDKNPLRERCVL